MSSPSPVQLYDQTGGGDAYRVAMLEHGYLVPTPPWQEQRPGKRLRQCGLTHETSWSEWREYIDDFFGPYWGRWCRTCSTTQACGFRRSEGESGDD